MEVTVGQELITIIKHSKKANLPPLLVGASGVGKSAIFQQAAAELGIGYICRDLSIMEPPDFQGLPSIRDGKTIYAPPSFLPQEGDGLFILEELNRAPRYMRAPCLQLLTERCLNDYRLPLGWLPCAAINPNTDDYEVYELDPALLSRFLVLNVKADPETWVSWAATKNLHSKVINFVRNSTDIFNTSSPRSWTYVSQMIVTNESDGNDKNLLALEIAGLVGEKWGGAFMSYYLGGTMPLSAIDIVDNYPLHQPTFLKWLDEKKMDLIGESWKLLKRKLKAETYRLTILKSPGKLQNLKLFLSDLPGDLKKEMKEFFDKRSIDLENINAVSAEA